MTFECTNLCLINSIIRIIFRSQSFPGIFLEDNSLTAWIITNKAFYAFEYALAFFYFQTSQRFGVCLDTAWFLDAEEDPLRAIDEFQDRLYGVHLKDFVFNADGKHEDVIIGTGGLDLPKFMKKLQEIDYNGYLSLEYEGDEHNPIPNTVKCVEAVRNVIREL